MRESEGKLTANVNKAIFNEPKTISDEKDASLLRLIEFFTNPAVYYFKRHDVKVSFNEAKIRIRYGWMISSYCVDL